MEQNSEFLNQTDGSEKKEKTVKKPKKEEKIETLVAEEIAPTFDLSIIDQTLNQQNITEETINAMKEEFMALSVKGIDDKEGYKTVDEKRKFAKKVRILAETLCKQGRADAIAIQKAWINKEKDVVSRIKEIEDYLGEQLKIVDEEKARIKEEEARKIEARIHQRTNRLISLGMTLVGDKYILESHIIDTLHVKIYDDFTFESIVAPVEARAQEIAAEKAAEDEKLKKLQEEQEAERVKLQKEREEFEAQQRKAREEEEARQKKVFEEQAKFEAEKKALIEAKIKARKSSLFALGFSQQFSNMVLKGSSISDNILENQSEEDWLLTFENAKHHSDKVKAEIEKERQEQIEKEKQAAVEAERKRLEAEAKAKAEKEAKEKAEAEAKAKKDEEEKLRQEALRPDEDKYNLFIKELSELKFPEFATEEYKKFGSYMNTTVAKMINHFNKEKQKQINNAAQNNS